MAPLPFDSEELPDPLAFLTAGDFDTSSIPSFDDAPALLQEHARANGHGHGREGHGREGHGREGHGREGHGREGNGREGNGREGNGRDSSTFSIPSEAMMRRASSQTPFPGRFESAPPPLRPSASGEMPAPPSPTAPPMIAPLPPMPNLAGASGGHRGPAFPSHSSSMAIRAEAASAALRARHASPSSSPAIDGHGVPAMRLSLRRPDSSANLPVPHASSNGGHTHAHAPVAGLDSTDAEFLVRQGKVSFEAGRFSLAAAFFQRAASIAPFRDDVRAYLQQAVEEQVTEVAREPAPASAHSAPRPGVPAIDLRAEVDTMIRQRTAERLSGADTYLPAATQRGVVPFRASAFRWLWRGALVAVIAAVGVVGWPVIAQTAATVIDLRPASEREAEKILADAENALTFGRPEEARTLLERGMGLTPLPEKTKGALVAKLAAAEHALGLDRSRDEKYEEAAERFEKAIALDGSVAAYHTELGIARFMLAQQSYAPSKGNKSLKKDELGRALRSFEQAITLAPDDLQSMSMAADCHVKLGQAPMAVPLWQKIIAVANDPTNTYVKRAERSLRSNGY